MLRAYVGGQVFGEASGPEPVRVLLLHGWARTHGDFRATAELLAARGYGSVAIDLPGFGASPPPAASGGARTYAPVVEAVLREVAPDGAIVVGHSFGGRVGLVVAAQSPDLVRALVVTGAPLVRTTSTRRAPARYRAARWLHRHGWLAESRLDALRQRYGSADYRAASGVMRDVLVATVNESYDDELANWRGPTAMVWGAGDTDVPESVAERARTMLAGPTTLRVLDGVGHLVPTEAPDALADAVLEVLA